MKRISIILFLLLAIPGLAHSQMNVGILGGGVTAAEAVSVEKDSQKTTGSSDWWATNDKWYAGGSFVAGSSYTLTRIDVYQSKGGSPTFNQTLTLYTSALNKPSTLVATSTNTPTVSSLSTSCGTLTFNFNNIAITNGTEYFIVGEGHGDGSNYLNWCFTTGTHYMVYSIDASTWTSWKSSSDIGFVTYGY
jgi:hypothetical protein